MNHLSQTQIQAIRAGLDAGLSLRLISIEGNTSINTAVRYRLYYNRGICGNCRYPLHAGQCLLTPKRRRTVKDVAITTEKRAAIIARFRTSLNTPPSAHQAPPARVTPPAAIIPRRAPTPASAVPTRSITPRQATRFSMPPKRPPPNPERTTPDRKAELVAQERFLATRGATILPPMGDPVLGDLPPMMFDYHTKKWTRRPDALTRIQLTRTNEKETC